MDYITFRRPAQTIAQLDIIIIRGDKIITHRILILVKNDYYCQERNKIGDFNSCNVETVPREFKCVGDCPREVYIALTEKGSSALHDEGFTPFSSLAFISTAGP